MPRLQLHVAGVQTTSEPHHPLHIILYTTSTSVCLFHGSSALFHMDITQFAVGGRDSALLIGDYNAYRSQLSRQLLAVRKRLGRATPKNAKFAQKAPVTAENVAQNREYVMSAP